MLLAGWPSTSVTNRHEGRISARERSIRGSCQSRAI